jgi:hypothetical protein
MHLYLLQLSRAPYSKRLVKKCESFFIFFGEYKMGKKKKNTSICWVDDTNILFVDYRIIPNSQMDLGCKINCVTRLVFLIAVVLLLLQLKSELVVIYFLTAILIIIMVYYKEKQRQLERMSRPPQYQRENFEINYTQQQKQQAHKAKENIDCTPASARVNYNCKKPDDNTYVNPLKLIKENLPKNDYTMKNNYNTAEYNGNFATVTDNQSLVGRPNPKTLVAPYLAPRSLDMDMWKNDDTYGKLVINEKKNQYHIESGYQVNDNGCYNRDVKPLRSYSCPQKKNKPASSYNKINESQPSVLPPKPGTTVPGPAAGDKGKEAFQMPYEIKSKYNDSNNTDNLFHKGFKNNPVFQNKYNENVFTQTISPGDYRVNTRNEPINSNMGITLAEQNEPANYEMIEPYEDVNASNVYDPRFYGYGTSYRGFVDNMLGQPKFYYDDVNAIRMPNYVSRNNIDVMPFGDAYGPDNAGGNPYHNNITALADKHYLDSSLQFRSEMQERLMRKVNANQWQQRMFPINKNGQRMAK